MGAEGLVDLKAEGIAAVFGDAAAEDDGIGVEQYREGGEAGADGRGGLMDQAGERGVAGVGALEDFLGSGLDTKLAGAFDEGPAAGYRLQAAVAATPAGRLAGGIDDDVAGVAETVVGETEQAAVDHHAGADAGAHGEEEHAAAGAAVSAEIVFSIGTGGDVVLDADGEVEAVLEEAADGGAVESGQVAGAGDPALVVEEGGQGDANAGDGQAALRSESARRLDAELEAFEQGRLTGLEAGARGGAEQDLAGLADQAGAGGGAADVEPNGVAGHYLQDQSRAATSTRLSVRA